MDIAGTIPAREPGAPLAPPEPEAELITDLILRDHEIQFGQFFRVGPNGLVVTGRPTFETCDQFGRALHTIEGSIQFSTGDFINWVEGTFGEEASQIVDAESWREATVSVYRWVSAKIAPKNRRMTGGLSFSHHQEVADLEPSEQVLWLERAEKGDGDGSCWTRERLRRELRAVKDGKKGSASRPDIFQVIVTCADQADMEACCRQLDTLGRKDYKTKSSND